ncbi:MAG: tetratricopeptide repeat protein, partial [Verrucomicrobiota bacterium]
MVATRLFSRLYIAWACALCSFVIAPAWGKAQTASSAELSSLWSPVRTKQEAPRDLGLGADAQQRAEAYAQFAWGFYLLQQSDSSFDSARDHLLQALSALPESEFILGHVVSAIMDRQGHEGVAEALLPLAKLNPQAVPLNLVVAEALSEVDQTDAAIEQLKACGKHTGWENTAIFRQLAVLLWQSEQPEEMRALIERLLKKDSLQANFDLHYLAAMYYRSMLEDPPDQRAEKEEEEEEEEEEVEKEKSAADSANERRRKRRRERMLHHAGKAAELVRDLESERDLRQLTDLLQAYQAWEPLATMLGKALNSPRLSTISMRLLYAESLLKSGRRDEALVTLRELRKDRNLSPPAVAEAGRLFVEAGDIDEAISMYERFTRGGGTPPRSIARGLGYLYLRADRPDKAVQLVENLPSPGAHDLFLLARAHYQQSNPKKAYQTVRKLFAFRQREPDFAWKSPQFLLFAATVAEETGHVEKAVQWAEKAHQEDPENAVAANFLGYVLADHNRRLDEAEELIKQALEQEPENPAYLDSLAWVLYRQGKHRDALTNILHALRAQEGLNDGVILDHAGDICRACGLETLAQTYWREALADGQIMQRETLRNAVR